MIKTQQNAKNTGGIGNHLHRVLIILPFYGGSLPIGQHCATALRDIGCLVEVFQAPEFYPAFTALQQTHTSIERLNFLENNFLQCITQIVLAKVESFQPNLVLSLAQAPLSLHALKVLKQAKIVSAMWFVEDFQFFTYWRTFAPYYDIFAVIQKDHFLEQLKRIGQNHAIYLPLAALPSFHAPCDLNAEELAFYKADVSFLGAGYPNRRKAFPLLSKYDFKLWGSNWENCPELAPYLQKQGARIEPAETVRIYNATTININLHSSINADKLISNGDFINPRTFELAACGAFQLVDRRQLFPELFAEDELAIFDDWPDLEEKINYFLKHPEERKQFIEKSRAKVLSEHTYQQRMLTLLRYAETNFPHFISNPEESFSENFPEKLRENILSLLQELQLPPSTSLDTIATALQSKEGQLSELEAALCFLYAWQKTYQSLGQV